MADLRLAALAREKLGALGRALTNARWVSEHRGVSLERQARDLLWLKLHGISAYTYYLYALFDRRRFPERRLWLTYRDPAFSKRFWRLADPSLHRLGRDKHLQYRLFQAMGLPVPGIRAFVCPRQDGFEGHRALRTTEDLRRFLQQPGHYPLFGKPARGTHGRGCLGMVRLTAREQVQLLSGETWSVDRLALWIWRQVAPGGTYLLTELLCPHEDFQRLSGDALPSLRAMVLVPDGAPIIFALAALIPAGPRHTSNIDGLTTGNLCGAVDPETGVITHVLASLGPDLREVTAHPVSGLPLGGHRIANWSAVRALIDATGRAFAPFGLLNLDIGLSRRGPVLLEHNLDASLRPIQMHGPPGIFTPQLAAFLRARR